MQRDGNETLEASERVVPTAGAPELQPALLKGRYRLAELVGRGGMGEVIAARDIQIGRDVAIKRMRATDPSERAVRRFLREASIQGRLEHHAIVPVHEIGYDDDGQPFFAMKKLAGETLSQLLSGDRGAFPLQRALRAFADVCLAVELAHVRGIVHRDLNPNNIMLGDFGEVYVLDWGVAKIIGEPDGDFADVTGTGEHATIAGTAVGTPGYMAPEQAAGQLEVDGRADVYTLGCVLFEVLYGRQLHAPIGSAATTSDAGSGDTGVPPPLDQRGTSRSSIAPELDELWRAATAKDRNARIGTARELGDRVHRFLDGDRDVALRGKLAREHLAKATASFERGDTDDLRRSAMRNAAAAIALDPGLAGAAELVGRLMLEPPRVPPREVEEAIASDDASTVRTNHRAGIWATVATLGFLPFLWWMAPGALDHVIVFAAVLVGCGVVSLVSVLGALPRTGLVAIANAVLIAILARMFSPLLIAPAVAAVLGMSMVAIPRFSRLSSPPAVAALLSCAVLVPWLLERVGAVGATMTGSAHGLLLHAPGLIGNDSLIFIVGAVYVTALIAGVCAAGEVMRRRIRDAHRQLHVQSWQLRQLLPTEAALVA